MATLGSIASRLREQLAWTRTPKLALAADAGITHRTLSHVLSGEADYKVSTLLAVIDRLGLDVVIVPKSAAAGLVDAAPRASIRTAVDVALERIRGSGDPGKR